ncbi:hypothetical protein [Cronobacter malonaticus]|uniref:hypothetical protein n=1 Tax=Cronobacter malonaticus TaxID=413503 RepID=UPI0029C0A624|nr:hypothetical protein [Cronobacter malonaticus]ELY2640123.1 hypothetical protein [Cronobacter sakazakii]
MTPIQDVVELYGLGLGLCFAHKNVIVEGTSDVGLFELAAKMELKATGNDLLGTQLAFIASGERERGGTNGVIRQLITLRSIARTCLLPNGMPKYRFVGLFDNDYAGKQASTHANKIDSSMIEYKDFFRVHPVMPIPGNILPEIIKRSFERENVNFKKLDWEIEDYLPKSFIDAFADEYPKAISKTIEISGKIHRDFTTDGKVELHKFVKAHANYDDLNGIIDAIKAIRFYLNIKSS